MFGVLAFDFLTSRGVLASLHLDSSGVQFALCVLFGAAEIIRVLNKTDPANSVTAVGACLARASFVSVLCVGTLELAKLASADRDAKWIHFVYNATGAVAGALSVVLLCWAVIVLEERLLDPHGHYRRDRRGYRE
jgi:hypothetical protein